MRSESIFIEEILSFARSNSHIFLVAMEGSRTNVNIAADYFQDYDITFFTDDINVFTKDDSWLNIFGEIVMMQKPEDMELFEASEAGYSFLVIYEDHLKLDLTIRLFSDLNEYLKEDSLRKILLDKKNVLQKNIIPSDCDYWIKKPSERSFDDCCNEFWFLTSYVIKGLYRHEILYAIDHLTLLRKELLRMISWYIGNQWGFDFSVGKNYKFINKYLPEKLFSEIILSFDNSSYEKTAEAFFHLLELFRQISRTVSEQMGYRYPGYDAKMTKYLNSISDLFLKTNS